MVQQHRIRTYVGGVMIVTATTVMLSTPIALAGPEDYYWSATGGGDLAQINKGDGSVAHYYGGGNSVRAVAFTADGTLWTSMWTNNHYALASWDLNNGILNPMVGSDLGVWVRSLETNGSDVMYGTAVSGSIWNLYLINRNDGTASSVGALGTPLGTSEQPGATAAA